MMNFSEEFDSRIAYIENVLHKYAPKEEGMQKTIIKAMNYSLMAGGKRLRPMFMLEVCRMFGGTDKTVEPFMAVIEMIHTYSLVHDDLPALDNDDYRRGRKTTHVVFGEAIGILAGDALLNFAFEIGTKAVIESEYQDRASRVLHYIAVKSGIYGMIGGQTVDVINEGRKLDIDTINFIHNLKTAALIEAAMVTGAIMAGADKQQIEQVERAANDIGIAFQIQDDILDVTGSTQVLGKPAGSDERNNKDTYVSIKGIRESSEMVEFLSNRAMSTLSELGKNDFLIELIMFLINRKK